MPREVTDLVAQLVLPPAGPLLVLALGALLAWRKRRTAGITLGVVAFSALWISSLGATGRYLLEQLEPPPAAESALATGKAIVVLGASRVQASPEYSDDVVNGEGLVRLRYGARLARRLDLPLLVAGGKPYGGARSEGRAMAAALAEDFKTPARWIEEQSSTTAENAARSFAILRPEGRIRIALVTSAWHMRRAQLVFAKAGFDVVAAPTGYASRGEARALDWIPSASGLYATRTALWEWLGIAWYRLNGAG
jgi:uncharacterized SAM-binding protein YcdF (DUF218 family)